MIKIGQKFTRLTVLSLNSTSQISGKMRTTASCKCECGKFLTVRTDKLKFGGVKSCGCLKKDMNSVGRHRTHGMSKQRIYKLWAAMLQRCNNPDCEKYHYYGGRGIKVYPEWHTFQNFFTDMGHKPIGLSLDRVNNDGNYEPTNCRWASHKVQANNKRNSPQYQ